MQEQREAREAGVFNENKDWVTETEIRRPRPQGGVLGTFPATNNHSFAHMSQLVTSFTVAECHPPRVSSGCQRWEIDPSYADMSWHMS